MLRGPCRHCGRTFQRLLLMAFASDLGASVSPSVTDCDHEFTYSREELLEHLRTTHGFADLEPGGALHVPGDTGWVQMLDERTTKELRGIHDEDHVEYAGKPVVRHEHGGDDGAV